MVLIGIMGVRVFVEIFICERDFHVNLSKLTSSHCHFSEDNECNPSRIFAEETVSQCWNGDVLFQVAFLIPCLNSVGLWGSAFVVKTVIPEQSVSISRTESGFQGFSRVSCAALLSRL